MGWFDNVFGSRDKDPLQSLDPKLRQLLERESPVKYEPAPAPQQPRAESHTPAPQYQASSAATETTEASRVPPESLFQDGRYAHLWKTYRPLHAVEEETKSSNEKLMDMLEGYKERHHRIAKTALENCAFEQEDWANCMKGGSWEDRLQMCRHQVRRFERCYLMQAVCPETIPILVEGELLEC
jgi:hypothetical protein